MRHLEFPRCLFPLEDLIIRKKLHTFFVASEEAFSAESYLRIVYQTRNTETRQLKAATKLVPRKRLSIPRLKLNGALLWA